MVSQEPEVPVLQYHSRAPDQSGRTFYRRQKSYQEELTMQQHIKKQLLDKKQVAGNIRRFAYFKYGSIKKLAEALDMNPVTLHSGYLNSRSLPGPVLLFKLMNAGCNLSWLFTGKGHPVDTNQNHGRVEELERENRILRSIVQGQLTVLNGPKEVAEPVETRFAVNS
jgi:hypothetical protein